MSPIDYAGSGTEAAANQRVFLRHTSELGKPDEKGSFVAAGVRAVPRTRRPVTDMAYRARPSAPAPSAKTTLTTKAA